MKKFIFKLLTVIFALTLSLGLFTACGDTSETPNPPTHTHDYNALKYDGANHWYECECGEKQTAEAHKGGTATETTKSVCDICNQEYGEFLNHEHNFNKKINIEEYLASEATCEEKAKYYYICTCWERGSETYEYGEPLYHNYVDKQCTKCDDWIISEGLIFEEYGNGYSVKSVGDCNDEYVVIPKTYNNRPILKICDNAFTNNSKLTGVVIPETVKEISHSAFENCENFNKINYLGTVDEWAQIYFGSFELMEIPTWQVNNLHINNELLTDAKIINATKISDFAFWGVSSLKSIEISNTVKFLGVGAFYSNFSLKNVTFAKNSQFTSIGICTFYGAGLESIEIPSSVTSINEEAFLLCESLQTVTFEEGSQLNKICDSAFAECSMLENIKIPNSVTSLDSSVFHNCSSLTSITIPSSVTNIGRGAFYGCVSLESITVEENNANYKSIDGNLYSKDGKTLIQYAIGKTATSFTIPNSVTNIGDYAFQFCTSLERVVIPNSVISIGFYTLAFCDSLTIYCEIESQPNGWEDGWDYYRPVVWGYKGE